MRYIKYCDKCKRKKCYKDEKEECKRFIKKEKKKRGEKLYFTKDCRKPTIPLDGWHCI